MGLTLHYRLTALAGLSARGAAAFVRRLHAVAGKFPPGGRVAAVLPISSDRTDLDRWANAWRLLPHPDQPDTSVGVQIAPAAGWIFPVDLGDDCARLWLGLCRYPATVAQGGARRGHSAWPALAVRGVLQNALRELARLGALRPLSRGRYRSPPRGSRARRAPQARRRRRRLAAPAPPGPAGADRPDGRSRRRARRCAERCDRRNGRADGAVADFRAPALRTDRG
jgi:hypothetical protein